MRPLPIFLILCGGFFLSPQTVRGEIQPSFALQDCAWNATHIVEVTQGIKRDAVFTILESWKGDLGKGKLLVLPELLRFSPEEKRRIFAIPGTKVPPNRVTNVSGFHIVLFLKKKTADGLDPKAEPVWQGAGVFPELMSSVAWIDGGEAFAYVQIINPGGPVLWPLERTEKQFKTDALKIIATKETFEQALEEADTGKRAKRLSVLVQSDLYRCRSQAVQALARCGEKALPIIKKLINDNPRAAIVPELFRAMGKAGGTKAGKELASILREEFAFWKKRGPELNGDWWHGRGLEVKELRSLQHRIGKFSGIICALAEANDTECRPLVREVYEFLKAHPHLDAGGGNGSRYCRFILGENE